MNFKQAFNYLLNVADLERMTFPVLECIIFSADCYQVHSSFSTTARLIDGYWDVDERGCFKSEIDRSHAVEPFAGVEERELTWLEKDSFDWVLKDLKSRPQDWRIGNYPYRFIWQRAFKEHLKVVKLPFIKGLFREMERERVTCRDGRILFNRWN